MNDAELLAAAIETSDATSGPADGVRSLLELLCSATGARVGRARLMAGDNSAAVETIVSPDAESDGLQPCESVVSLPVRSEGDVIGSLELGFDLPVELAPGRRRILEAVGVAAGRLVERAQGRSRTSELERSNAELDRFAYIASHDLKAPLRGISNLAHWLLEDLGEGLDPQSRHHLNLLIGRVERMEALIEGILRYSRVNRADSQPELVSVREVVDQALALLQPPADVELEIDDDLPELVTSEAPLEQVFRNLISNALVHADTRGLRIRIECEDRGSCYRFRVRDNGPGIDPRHHERIFHMFCTLQPRDRLESTGIGLALVKKIVECRGGRVTVESTPGEGATFCVDWPKEERQLA